MGELSLDGLVRHTRGVLPMAATARLHGFTRMFVPEVDAPEAALIPDLEVIPVKSLADLYKHLSGRCPIEPYQPSEAELEPLFVPTDFSESAERVLGYSLERWSEPGFWQSILHPEDREATRVRLPKEGDRARILPSGSPHPAHGAPHRRLLRGISTHRIHRALGIVGGVLLAVGAAAAVNLF